MAKAVFPGKSSWFMKDGIKSWYFQLEGKSLAFDPI